jgi:hypothetical protein
MIQNLFTFLSIILVIGLICVVIVASVSVLAFITYMFIGGYFV